MIFERFLNDQNTCECEPTHAHGGGVTVNIAQLSGKDANLLIDNQAPAPRIANSPNVIETNTTLITDRTREVAQNTITATNDTPPVTTVTTAATAPTTPSSSQSQQLAHRPHEEPDPQDKEVQEEQVRRIILLVTQISNCKSPHDRRNTMPNLQEELKAAIIVLLGAHTWNDNLLRRAETILREYQFIKEASQLHGAVKKKSK